MFYSDKFLSRLARLRKEHREAPEAQQIQMVRDAFTSLVRSVPEPMIEELFDQFTGRLLQRGEGDSIFIERAEYLADVADLLAGQYDSQNDPLHPDDWKLVGDIVNEYAHDLDMEHVTYVMQLVIEHHGT